MSNGRLSVITIAILLPVVVLAGCVNEPNGPEASDDTPTVTASRDEHARDEGGDGEGEESGAEYALNQSYDQVRNGARLVLAYDAPSNTFNGTVQNTTAEILERVRVEVHLSNGQELGPTTPVDLAAGETRTVTLAATSTGFDGWTAHPEVGGGEAGHGHEGDEDEGHDEGEGEHREGREDSEEHR